MWASALLAGLTACSSDHAQLDLTVAGATEAIIVRIEGERTVPWDTVAITHGQLTMELPVDSTLQTFYFLLFDTGGSMRLGIQPGDRFKDFAVYSIHRLRNAFALPCVTAVTPLHSLVNTS